MITKQEIYNGELLEFYVNQVKNDFLEYWDKAVDDKYGGIFTCYDNEGVNRVSEDKYTWSQGRFIWLWSRLIRMHQWGFIDINVDKYKQQVTKTCEFIRDKAFLENGNCCFILDRKGEKKETKDGVYDASIYADCFVAIGFAEYAKAANSEEYLDLTLKVYDNIYRRILNNSYRTDPYPIPAGYRAHPISMIMLNVTAEVYTALQQLNNNRIKEFEGKMNEFMDDILHVFCREDDSICELLSSKENNTLISRHNNPGHALECMWFVLDAASLLGKTDEVIEKVMAISEKELTLGWDTKHGGLLRFVDYEGGQPRGEKKGYPYEKLILDTWNTKLWWPHSESLYTTMRIYSMTEKESFFDWYKTLHDYIFSTFPNENREVGEWIQIRDREGKPIEKVVALPVKDPFHILRNMFLMIQLLSEIQGE